MKVFWAIWFLVMIPAIAAQEAVPPRKEALYIHVQDDAAETLGQLQRLGDAGHWPRAAAEAQRLIADATDTLYEIEPGLYVSFAEKVRRDVCAWPEPGVNAYRALYEKAAAKLYEEAAAARSRAGLSAAANLYLPTRAGALALATLADIHAESGELREALRSVQRLLTLPESAALAREALREKRDALEKALRAIPAEPRTPGTPSLAVSAAWSFSYRDGDVGPDTAAGLRSRGFRVPLVSQPVCCGENVLIQAREWVAALDGRTGDVLWRYPAQPRRPSPDYAYDAFLAPVVLGSRLVTVVGGRVVALSVVDGKEAWTAAPFAEEANAPGGRNTGVAVLVNSVAVGDGKVFACATMLKQETEFVAAALAAQTGAVLWRRKLCSQVFRGELGRGVQPAPPAFADGTLFVSTNLGAVVAVQPETGEVRWLAKYRAFTPERRHVAFRTDDCWENNPPVICGDLVLVAPQDADDLIAFDVETGRQVWRAPRLGARYLVGADADHAYVSGPRAAAVNLRTGKVAWLSERLGLPAGRPTLFGPNLLVPTKEAFVALDAATGKAVSRQLALVAPGNLAVAGDRLVSASFDRVNGYRRGFDASQPYETPLVAAGDGQQQSRAQMAIDASRTRLAKRLAELADDAENKKDLLPVWRTPLDTTRFSPVVLAPEANLRVGESAVVVLATQDAGNPGTFLWDSVECRRAADGWLLWRTCVRSCLGDAVALGDKLVLRAVSRLIALDLGTGRELWAAGEPAGDDPVLNIGRMLEARRIHTIDAAGGRVFAATGVGEVFALDAETGKEAWRRKLAAFPVGGALYAVGGQVVVCGENPGTVYWLDAETGQELRAVRPDRADSRLTDSPALQSRASRLCLVVGDREVRNLRLDTGATLWKTELPFSIGRIAATRDERRIIVFPDRWSFGGKVTCLDAASGRSLWAARALAKDPSRMHLAGDAVLSFEDGLAADTLTAQRIDDGQVLWSRKLRVGSVFDTWTDAGDFVIVSGSVPGDPEWCGQAVCVQKTDGALWSAFERRGAAYSSVAVSAGLCLFCSNRGIEAYRAEDERAAASRLMGVLGGGAAKLPTTNEATAELARLLLVHREHETAMALLDDALLAEHIDPAVFERLHEMLMAAREATAEARPAAYDAPRFTRPPEIDGRLSEDWRRDRAAVLDRARSIERVHAPQPAGRFWIGPNDLSATLYLGWDAEHLYIAVDVNDSIQVTHDFDAPVWKGDCLIVGIDPEGDGGYRLGSTDTVFWLALTGKQQQPRDEEQRLGGEHSIKVKEDESGTVYELAVPWAEIGIPRPRPGLCFGLNIMVIDDDGPGAFKAASWTPGLTQNRKKDRMSAGIAPALFGAVTLKEN